MEKDYSLATLSTGDLLRKAVTNGTPIGQRVKSILENGQLVDDETVLGLVTESLIRGQIKTGWVLDGYPRNLNQANQLDAILEENGKPLNLALCLDVPDEEIVDRICNRWVHIPSGRVYHTTYSPPQKPGFDDVTGEPLSQRSDDTIEKVQERLRIYREKTSPLLDYYSKKGILTTITSRTSDEGYVHIKRTLDQHAQNLAANTFKQKNAL